MFNTHICKNCFSSFSGKPEVCPHCGEPTGFVDRKKASEPITKTNSVQADPAVSYVASDSVKEPKKPRKKHRLRVPRKEIMEGIKFEDLMQKTNDKDVTSWRERKKERNKPQFSVQNNGEYNIDTSDVTYLPNTYTYSIKKARGEVTRPKIKWWEIYKWADLMLARRKIKKQVKRASYYRPKEIKLWKMYILCILFGWFGLHDFYARNYRKGFVAAISFTIGCTIAFNWLNMLLFTAGLFLFIPVCMWILDIINLIFGTYSYKLSRWKFIDCLNADTRATLGSKYLDKDEYKKLWTIRMINKIRVAINNKKANKQQKLPTQDLEQKKQDNAPVQNQTEQLQAGQSVTDESSAPVAPKATGKKINKKPKVVIKPNKNK